MQKSDKKFNAKPVGATSSRPHFEGMSKENKGITLIALIITIIVMLILVGVTVNVAISGGIFSTANQAAKDTERHTIYDQIVGAMKINNNGKINVEGTYSDVVNIFGRDKVRLIDSTIVDENTIEVMFNVTGNRGIYTYKITGEEIIEEKIPDLTETHLLEENYKLVVGERTITIPEGFGVVDTTGDEETLIDDATKYQSYIETNIENGIVIQDEVENEFVWIPVDDINSMVMCQSAEKIPEGAPEGTDGRCTLELQEDILKCTKHNSEALAGRLYAKAVRRKF